jgi:hypothetical protein
MLQPFLTFCSKRSHCEIQGKGNFQREPPKTRKRSHTTYTRRAQHKAAMSRVPAEWREAKQREQSASSVMSHCAWAETVLRSVIRRTTRRTPFRPLFVQTVEASTKIAVKERGYL